MGEKGVGKLSRETPPPREGEPMGANGKVKKKKSLYGYYINKTLKTRCTTVLSQFAK